MYERRHYKDRTRRTGLIWRRLVLLAVMVLHLSPSYKVPGCSATDATVALPRDDKVSGTPAAQASAPGIPPVTPTAPPTPPTATIAEQLSRIAKTHQVVVHIAPSLDLEQKTELVAGQLPPEAAIALLLKNHDYFLLFTADKEKGANRLTEVWAFAKGTGADLQLVSTQELQRAAAAPGGADTAAPLDDQSKPIEEREAIINELLATGDEDARDKALQAATGAALAVPQQQLEDVLKNDPSERVRISAFNALKGVVSQDPSAAQILIDLALQDPSEAVQLMAKELQESLQSAGPTELGEPNRPEPPPAEQQIEGPPSP